MPLSILRVKGVAVGDATLMVAFAVFAMFFFLTLYMQTVLGYSPIQAGTAHLPLTGATPRTGQLDLGALALSTRSRRSQGLTSPEAVPTSASTSGRSWN